MRKITDLAISAFMSATLNNGNFNLKNTKISASNSKVYMYLHDNIIAIRDFETNKISICNCGWFSNTTKERLNALPNVNIYQKSGKWYLNGKEWNGILIDIE